MPKYYFNLRVDDELILDEIGSVHANLDAAEQSAADMGRAILDRLPEDQNNSAVPRCIEITDEQGRDLLYVVFWKGPEISPEDLGLSGSPTIH